MLMTVIEDVGKAYVWMWEYLFLINVVFSFLIIFFQRRNPTTVWAWLLLLYFIPILGFILYLILGQNFHKERMFKMKEIEGYDSAEIMQITGCSAESLRQNLSRARRKILADFAKLTRMRIKKEV